MHKDNMYNCRRSVWLLDVGLIVFVTGIPTPQKSEMFLCFSDICEMKGYYVCSETERRCKECAIFYTDACNTEQQPVGCYGYCAELLNQSTHELKSAQARLVKVNDELRELNESNSNIRAINIELNISSYDLRVQNQKLNETNQEIKESLEKSEAETLFSIQKVEEENDISKRKTTGLSIGLGCSIVLVIALVIYTCRTKKFRLARRTRENEIRMRELNEVRGINPNIDVNANQPKGKEADDTNENADVIRNDQHGINEEPTENNEETQGDDEETDDNTEEPDGNKHKANASEKELTPESSNSSLSELTISGKGCR